jgi:hypothetical protein
VWRVKIEEDEEFPTSLVQGAEAIQGDIIATQEVSDTNKQDGQQVDAKGSHNPIVVFDIASKNPFLKMCQRLVHGGQ